MTLEIRKLSEGDISALRRLQSVSLETHMRYVLERFPRYYEALAILEPPADCIARQIAIWGAFDSGRLVGAVGLQRVPSEHPVVASESASETFYNAFSEHEIGVMSTLESDLAATYIGSPAGSLLVNSLHVQSEYRRQGIARTLVQVAIDFVAKEIDEPVYVEISRSAPILGMLQQLGFSVVKKTFSFSEWFQFSSWGAVLLVRDQNAA